MDTLAEPEPPAHTHDDTSPNEPVKDDAEPPIDTQEKPKDTNTEPSDAPICRICLMGAEESDELGRLIRPCLCRGTVGYVHVICLNTWRKASTARKAFWQCDQCGYKYRFVRTRALGLAQHPLVVGCSTLTLFTIFVFTASFVLSLFLPSAWIEGSSSTVSRLVDDSVETTFGESPYGFSYMPSTFANALWKISYQALNEIFDNVLPPSNTETSESTSYRYKAAPRAKRKARSRLRKRLRAAHDPSTPRSGPFKSTVSTPRVAAAERPVRLDARLLEDDDDDDAYDTISRRPSFLMRLLRRFLLGLSVVGALSLFTVGWTMQIPLQWARRRVRRGEARDPSLYTFIVVAVILYGIAKAMFTTYKVTQALTTVLLKRAETAILEVGSDEPVPLDQRPVVDVRGTFARMRTRVFWRDVWWEFVRVLRGAKDTVVDVLNAIRQEVRLRDIITALTVLFFAFMGVGGGGWGGGGGWVGGGVWVWQF